MLEAEEQERNKEREATGSKEEGKWGFGKSKGGEEERKTEERVWGTRERIKDGEEKKKQQKRKKSEKKKRKKSEGFLRQGWISGLVLEKNTASILVKSVFFPNLAIYECNGVMFVKENPPNNISRTCKYQLEIGGK